VFAPLFREDEVILSFLTDNHDPICFAHPAGCKDSIFLPQTYKYPIGIREALIYFSSFFLYLFFSMDYSALYTPTPSAYEA